MVTTDNQSKFALQAKDLNLYYADFRAVKDVNLSIERQKVTAIIGPSGCGKSTVLRSFNRMNELVPTARIEGEVHFLGQNIYDRQVDPVEVRRRIGMVFQKPNPFTKSIYENVAWGARLNGFRGGIGNPSMDEWVEHCLRKVPCGTVKTAGQSGCLRWAGMPASPARRSLGDLMDELLALTRSPHQDRRLILMAEDIRYRSHA
jgi:ABC-type phosphate transport system ATPase subunit